MKKVALGLMLSVCVAGASVFGLDFFSYPAGIRQFRPLFNAGAGIGRTDWGEKLQVPPVVVSAELPISVAGLPFSFGAMIMFERFTGEKDGYDLSWTEIAVDARAAYHLNLEIPNLDAYAALALGVCLENVEGESAKMYPWFDYGFFLGARYFFINKYIPNVGVYLEAGYSPLTIVSLGAAFKL
jgi:hypothetical protein